MANDSYGFTVEVDLKSGGFKAYDDKLQRMNYSTGAVVASTQKLSGGVKGMVSSMLLAVAVFSVASRAVQSLTQYVGDSVDAYRDFQESVTEVSTILDEQGMTILPSLEAGIEGLSKAFGKSATDLANGLYNILSAAVPAEDALALLYTSTKAAVAGLSDVSTSVDVMTSVLNAYGMTVEQMVHVSDVMFQSIIRGKFRFNDLASALGYVTPIAAQAGVSFEELAATMATATRHGQHIDMVSRGLALGMQNIIKPGEQAKEVAAQYGIELSLASLRAKGLVGFIEELNQKTKGNAAVISKIIPNMRSYRVMMVLAGEGVAGVKKDIELMSESMGKADIAFTKMAQTAQRQTDVIIQAAEDMRRQVGESFIGVDLFMKKMDIFKGMWAEEFTKNPFEAIVPSTGTMIRAWMNATKVWDQIDKQIERYSEKWREEFEQSLDPLVDTPTLTLFDRLQQGEDVDLSQYENQADAYLNAAEKWVDATLELEKQHAEGTISTADYNVRRFELEDEYAQVMELYDAYAYYKSAVDDAEKSIKDHSASIDIYTQSLSVLKEEIGTIGVLYDGQLGKQLKVLEQDEKVANMTHYLSLALEDEKYQIELASQGFGWYNEEVANAISVVRAYEKQQKAATAAQKEFNFALAENQIAMMEIQLIGMMRRRGLTRSEERMMKALQIERTELQIDEAKRELEEKKNVNDLMIDDKEQTYYEAKAILEGMERDEQHYLWTLKNTRSEDIQSLKNQITTKELAYMNLSQTILETHNDMEGAVSIYAALVESYYGDQIPANVQNSIDAFKKLAEEAAKAAKAVAPYTPSTAGVAKGGKVGGLVTKIKSESSTQAKQTVVDFFASGGKSFQRGTWFVPNDMIALLHRGETVRPAGSDSGGGDVNVEILVTGNTLTGEADEDRLARKMSSMLDKRLGNSKTGKSNARLR